MKSFKPILCVLFNAFRHPASLFFILLIYTHENLRSWTIPNSFLILSEILHVTSYLYRLLPEERKKSLHKDWVQYLLTYSSIVIVGINKASQRGGGCVRTKAPISLRPFIRRMKTITLIGVALAYSGK